jgi:hypothetical protein
MIAFISGIEQQLAELSSLPYPEPIPDVQSLLRLTPMFKTFLRTGLPFSSLPFPPNYEQKTQSLMTLVLLVLPSPC